MVTPRISIIIPIYKTEKYLRNCLLSVQRQTMPDFEAILVNDCTTDGSMAIANEFIVSDSRFHMLEHRENQGLGCARNTGIFTASGEYINFLDSDDCLPMDSLQILLELADSNQADMVIGNMAWLSDHHLNPVKYIDQRLRSWITCWNSNLRELSPKFGYVGNVCNRLFRTKILMEHSLKFPKHVYYEDIPFSFEAWFYSTRIFYTLCYVYFRTLRNDPENLSITQIYNEKAFLDRDLIAQYVYDFACNHNNTRIFGAIILKNMLCTAESMLNSVDKDKKTEIIDTWYPQHSKRLDDMIKQLNS
ncbi:MAG: glycosyltransferase [Anaerolineales bacterium]|nr:glycosyltransferase [Anaerolineales bacterium]